MSDVTPDVEALADVDWLAGQAGHEAWCSSREDPDTMPCTCDWSNDVLAIMQLLPALLRADSPSGDALRERLGLRAEYLADLGPEWRGALEGPMSLTDAQEISVGPIQRRFVTSWEATP